MVRAGGRAAARSTAGTASGTRSEAVLQPVRGANAFESTVEALASAIRLGVFPAGQRLPPERDLAERMGVSRATLREAIAALRQTGMVRTTRGRGGGTIVAYEPDTPTRDAAVGRARIGARRREEVLDCLTYRHIVEPGACWAAARVARDRGHSPQQRLLLLSSLEAVDAAMQAGDHAAHRQADSRLHLAVASLSGSSRIIAAVTDVQGCLHDLLTAIPVLPVNIEHSGAQHREIVSAVLGGEPDRARRAMEQHCDDTAALIRGLLD